MNLVLLENSLLVGSLATMLATIFGFGAALFMICLPRGWRNLFLATTSIALALPPFLVTNCWLHFLGHTGVWRSRFMGKLAAAGAAAT
jgi:ABC-type Fe3+ transport system permease subunit